MGETGSAPSEQHVYRLAAAARGWPPAIPQRRNVDTWSGGREFVGRSWEVQAVLYGSESAGISLPRKLGGDGGGTAETLPADLRAKTHQIRIAPAAPSAYSTLAGVLRIVTVAKEQKLRERGPLRTRRPKKAPFEQWRARMSGLCNRESGVEKRRLEWRATSSL